MNEQERLLDCLQHAQMWSYLKKSRTFVAVKQGLAKIYVQQLLKTVYTLVQKQRFEFSHEELDAVDPRLTATIQCLNTIYHGARRRQQIAGSLRASMDLWNKPPVVFQLEGEPIWLKDLIRVSSVTSDADDLTIHISRHNILHAPEQPMCINGVQQDYPFLIAGDGVTKFSLHTKETDIALRFPNLMQRMYAGVALDLDRTELTNFVLKQVTLDTAIPLPLNLTGTLPDML